MFQINVFSGSYVMLLMYKISFYRAAVLNEDEEDSAESSTDEEAEVTTYVTNDAE